MTKKFSLSQWLSYIFLILMSVVWVIPIVFGVTTSFRSQTEVVSVGFRFLPVNWVIENYVAILENTSTAPIIRWLGNSLFIATAHTILVVFIISITAYGYTRITFKYRDQLFFLLLGISMFPGIVNLIPSYKIIQTFGWVNSPIAMIVPGLAGMGNIFLVRQFMKGIPKEFDEDRKSVV